MASYAISNANNGTFGDQKCVTCRITGDGTAYTAGGDVLDPNVFGLSSIDYMIVQPLTQSLGFIPLFIRNIGTPSKLLISTNAFVELAGNNAKVFDVIVIGV